MENEKNIYDYTSEELKEKFNEDFPKTYSKFFYSEEDWKKISDIVDNFNSTILETNFPLALYNETYRQISEFKKINEPTSAKKVFTAILSGLGTFGKYVAKGFNSIRFVFTIFFLTLAAAVITFFIDLIIGNFIYPLLPNKVSQMVIETILGGILFIVFRTMIFCDREDRDLTYNHKKDIFKFLTTVPFYALIFLIFTKMDEIEIIGDFIYLFYPHMWLSAFTHEYVISPMIALVINSVIPVLIYLLIRKKTEK